MKKVEYKLERWEGNEFIITRNDKPLGCTLSKAQGEVLIKWLEQYGR